jgi:hypothetical protein
MPTLPLAIATVIGAFAPVFSRRVFEHARLLMVGAILAPGKRTITSVLRVMGRSDDEHFQNYHHVLNRIPLFDPNAAIPSSPPPTCLLATSDNDAPTTGRVRQWREVCIICVSYRDVISIIHPNRGGHTMKVKTHVKAGGPITTIIRPD